MVTFEHGGGIDWVGIGVISVGLVSAVGTVAIAAIAFRQLRAIRRQLGESEEQHRAQLSAALLPLVKPVAGTRFGYDHRHAWIDIVNIGLGPAIGVSVSGWVGDDRAELQALAASEDPPLGPIPVTTLAVGEKFRYAWVFATHDARREFADLAEPCRFVWLKIEYVDVFGRTMPERVQIMFFGVIDHDAVDDDPITGLPGANDPVDET